MTGAPEKIWHTIDRKGKISLSPDAHVEPCFEVSEAYFAYTRTDIYNDAIEGKDERIEELEAACEVVSSEFEGDLWAVCRRLLTKTHFDFSHAHVDGVHTDEFEGHMNETISEIDRAQARIAELKAALLYYRDKFCEHGGDLCGRLSSDVCAGCNAATALKAKP
jgi:hypothetical protein